MCCGDRLNRQLRPAGHSLAANDRSGSNLRIGCGAASVRISIDTRLRRSPPCSPRMAAFGERSQLRGWSWKSRNERKRQFGSNVVSGGAAGSTGMARMGASATLTPAPLHDEPTTAFNAAARHSVNNANVRNGPILTDDHRAQDGSLWHIVSCLEATKLAEVPSIADHLSAASTTATLPRVRCWPGHCVPPCHE